MPRVTQRIAADTGYSPHITPARVVERDPAPDHDPPIRAVLATAVTLYRVGLAQLLARQGRLHVVDTAASGAGAIAAVVRHHPRVVLLDMSMPDALPTVRALARSAPEVKVVAFAVDDREPELLACAEAGVAAYVSRDASAEELVAAVEGASRGEFHCTPAAAATLLRRVATLAARDHSATRTTPSARLTAREAEIGRLLGQGLSNKQIAGGLSIEVATVKNHVHHILEKLSVERRGDAVAAALARGELSGI